ncbi:hypothetical protein GUJ93_ZPchr0002g25950 [Zizania palustris]|uniref:Uncharacterized protein n=1 Tax=Zizania palustris TaxID=103762 RepID=A0A8J5SMU6_ZIZPA|nr:hypothetical protein GUJ93_ZPchr0002g25950 [Zizania palustris]
MGFFRWIAGIFGVSRDSAASAARRDKAAAPAAATAARNVQGRGFAVQVSVPVDRSGPGAVLVPCPQGDGGVQGFRWYTRKLRIDEDGDVADEFFDEVVPESLINNDATPVGRFQVKHNTRSAALAMRKQIIQPRRVALFLSGGRASCSPSGGSLEIGSERLTGGLLVLAILIYQNPGCNGMNVRIGCPQ